MTQVKDSFTYKWKKYAKQYYKPSIIKSLKKELEWGFSLDPTKYKKVLDAGSGLCRYYTFFPKTTEYHGIDISDSIKTAKKKYGKNKNFHAYQGDMLDLPFHTPHTQFDLILAMGSLHHTPSTETAFKYLTQFLTPQGELCAYIYAKKTPLREFLDDQIREQTTKMTPEQCLKFSKSMTNIGKELASLNMTINNQQPEIPEFQSTPWANKTKNTLQRFIYWNAFKCYWNPEEGYDYSIMTNFDWYHPLNAWRHTPEEIKQWTQDMGLTLISLKSSPSGHYVRCKK